MTGVITRTPITLDQMRAALGDRFDRHRSEEVLADLLGIDRPRFVAWMLRAGWSPTNQSPSSGRCMHQAR